MPSENASKVTVTMKGGNAYVNGVKPDKSWHQKLLDAGCTATRTGGLKIPQGKEPQAFMAELIGPEKLRKYGVEFVDADATETAVPPSRERANGLSVQYDRQKDAMNISGLTKEDKAAHQIIKDNGGKFTKGADPHWVIEKPVIKQQELYNQINATLNAKEEKRASAIELVYKGKNAYINGVEPGKSWHQKLLDAGCTATRTGGLKIPQGKEPESFVEEVIGENNLAKCGGLSIATAKQVEKAASSIESLVNAKVGDMTLGELDEALQQISAARTAQQVLER